MNKLSDTAEFIQAYEWQKNGNLVDAIHSYEKMLELSPNDIELLRCLGLAYAQSLQMSQAIDMFNRALILQPDDAQLHGNLANAYQYLKQDAKAIHHYQQALQKEPHYAQAHHNLANLYAKKNQYRQALNHYHKAVHAQPDYLEAHYHLGLLLLKNNQLDAAKTQFNNVLALQPHHLDALFYSGLLELNANHLDHAEQFFYRVLERRDDHIFSLTNLGVIAIKRDQGQQAIDFFTKALVINPEHIEARNNIAATFMHHDRFENALMHYDVLLKQDPEAIEYHYNSGVAQMALGHLPEAVSHFEFILTRESAHHAALTNLAAIKIRLNLRHDAIELLNRAIAANPNDSASQFMLHALTGDDKRPEPCTEYIHNLFDNYALYYDQHMTGTLQYHLPQTMLKTLQQIGAIRFKHTLDLGCGTGLSGMVLRELTDELIGIDLSPKMLAQAREKRIYDQLIEADCLTVLNDDKKHYDLIVAADVLPYYGDLLNLFTVIKQHLNPDGLFVFSCEISNEYPWGLQDSARFCHHPDYIQALCLEQNLTIVHEEKVVARQQDHHDLCVMLYVAKHQLHPTIRSP